MLRVVVDTNIWIYAVLYKVRIFEELIGFEIFTTQSVIHELERIAKGKGKEAIAAKIALELIKRNKVKILSINKPADEALLELAQEGFVVLTQDEKLREKIFQAGGKTGFLRQKRLIYLE